MKRKEYRRGTKRAMIAELANRNYTKRETFAQLRPLVESQTRPMIFSANVEGHREPKPISMQLIELKNEIGRVYAILGRATSSEFESEEIPNEEIPNEEIPDESDEEMPNEEEVPEEEDEEEEEEVAPVAAGKKRIRSEMEHFFSEVTRIRNLCIERARTSAPLDSIGMRPTKEGKKLIPAGIPSAALLHAMCLHWKPEIRQEAGIPDFDFYALSAEIMAERGLELGERHKLFGYALVLAENRVPIFLIGPAGTGKSTLLRQLADHMGLEYGETPITPGATRGDLLGRMTASKERPFILSKCMELYGNGGFFNFEELDAGDPGMLLVLNNALASDKFFNSANGETYEKSPDFVPAACGNTFGLGANKDYTGREKLDAATLDRWRMGRIIVELDAELERRVFFGE